MLFLLIQLQQGSALVSDFLTSGQRQVQRPSIDCEASRIANPFTVSSVQLLCEQTTTTGALVNKSLIAHRLIMPPKYGLTGFNPRKFAASAGAPANDPWKKV